LQAYVGLGFLAYVFSRSTALWHLV